LKKLHEKLMTRVSGRDREISDFVSRIQAVVPATKAHDGRARLLFALDATASREALWDQASHIQSCMFAETMKLGGLSVQLAYYRGFRDFAAIPWQDNAHDLMQVMNGIRCAAGKTQIERILEHAVAETRKQPLKAVVFVGDCMEEDVNILNRHAGCLKILGVPVFMFQEGNDPMAKTAFRDIARLSGGAYCSFDPSSARQLRDLLSAVAVFSSGGPAVLQKFCRHHSGAVALLARQITHNSRQGK